MTISDIHPSAMVAFAAAWGAIWGSFLNVCIHRVPRNLSVVHPRSSCPGCGFAIGALDNIPVLSWLFLRGRCRNCKTPISFRYPLVEGLTAILSVALIHGVMSGAGPDEPVVAILSVYLARFAFTAALLAVAFIDLDHLIIPNVISYPGIVLGLLYSLLPGGVTPLESLLGVVIGAGTILVLIHGYALIRGIQGMGFGDVKLLAMIGAFLGFKPLLFVLFAAALQGVLAALIIGLAKALGVKNLPLYDPSVLQEMDSDPEPTLGDDPEEQASSDAVPATAVAASSSATSSLPADRGGDPPQGARAGDAPPATPEQFAPVTPTDEPQPPISHELAQPSPDLKTDPLSPDPKEPENGSDLQPEEIAGDAPQAESTVEESEPETLSLLRAAIPFGPFLALGAIEYILIGEMVIELYIELVGRLVFLVTG